MEIQECPWKKNAKHVWWHNIFSGGQIHVIFGQNDFSWNLKFRKNLNFCQNLTSVGKAETLTAKSVCPNYNIPRFFSEIFKFCFQKSNFSSKFYQKIGLIVQFFPRKPLFSEILLGQTFGSSYSFFSKNRIFIKKISSLKWLSRFSIKNNEFWFLIDHKSNYESRIFCL